MSESRSLAPLSIDALAPDAGHDDFARLSVGLTQWMTASETVFLEAGERLRTAHGRIATVREGIARATEIFTRPVMADARGGLLLAAEGVRTVERLSAERGAHVEALHATVDDAASGSNALKSVFRILDYIVLIARAQVETMGSGQSDLVPFSRTVNDLVASGAEVAQAIDERMDGLRASLQEGRSIASRTDRLGGDADLMGGFSGLIDLIEQQQRGAAARREEAHVAFTAVWQAVAGAVMGLQAHDMARQRLEHTVRNLSILSAIGRDGCFAEGNEPVPAEQRGAAMHRVARLETAQLADLAETYGALMTKLGADLVAIADRLDACEAVLQRLRMPKAGQDGLAALEMGATRLRAAIEKGASSRRHLVESLERSVARTSLLIEMTDRMGALEFHLNLAGLNAAIQAAHVDGGDETIGYIARVIREQATQARVEADKVRLGIERAAEATADLSGRVLPAIAEAEAAIDTHLTGACEGLAAAEAECRDVLDGSVLAADGMSAEIRSVLQLMGLHEEGTRMMLALSAAIGSLAAGEQDAELPASTAERLDTALSAGYTMKEERDVFAAALGRIEAVGMAVGAEALAPAADDFDDILF